MWPSPGCENGVVLASPGVSRGHWLPSLPGLSNGENPPAFWSMDGRPNLGLVLLPSCPAVTAPCFGDRLWGTSPVVPRHEATPGPLSRLYLGFRGESRCSTRKRVSRYLGGSARSPAPQRSPWRSLAGPSPWWVFFAGSSLSSGHGQSVGCGSAESRLPVCHC